MFLMAKNNLAYTEEDFTNPLGVYGASKLSRRRVGFRSKSLFGYSQFLGCIQNLRQKFCKTMLNLFATKEELSIVADQFGQPTNANDL